MTVESLQSTSGGVGVQKVNIVYRVYIMDKPINTEGKSNTREISDLNRYRTNIRDGVSYTSHV